MNAPEAVAILEDNPKFGDEIKQQLTAKGIHAELFLTRNAFRESIGRGALFDLVVLDWYFEDPNNSLQAQLVLLNDLPNYRYVPVVVYTEEPDAAAPEIEGLARPANRTPYFAKKDITPEALAERISKWYEKSFSARLSAVWRRIRLAAFEQGLYELDALESTEFHRTLQRLLLVEAQEVFDIDHALEFLERYLSRKVLGNTELRDTLKAELAREQLPLPKTKQEKKEARLREPALVNAHAYSASTDRIARTGDIVSVTFPNGSLIAVVLTPACDLANAKSAELRLVEAEEVNREAARDAEWSLPPFKKDSKGAFLTLLVNFHRTFFVVPTKPQEGRLLTYDQPFKDRFGTEVKLDPLCRLDDPYRSDLLQHYSCHASRVGIP